MPSVVEKKVKHMAVSKSLIVSLAVLVSIGTNASSAGAQEVLVDATGKTIGTLHGTPESSWVKMRMPDGNSTMARVEIWGFVNTSTPFVMYVSPTTNCSPPKYYEVDAFNTSVAFKLKLSDTKQYIRYTVRPYMKIKKKSAYNWDPYLGKGSCELIDDDVYVGAFKTIDVGVLKYMPPFTVK